VDATVEQILLKFDTEGIQAKSYHKHLLCKVLLLL